MLLHIHPSTVNHSCPSSTPTHTVAYMYTHDCFPVLKDLLCQFHHLQQEPQQPLSDHITHRYYSIHSHHSDFRQTEIDPAFSSKRPSDLSSIPQTLSNVSVKPATHTYPDMYCGIYCLFLISGCLIPIACFSFFHSNVTS